MGGLLRIYDDECLSDLDQIFFVMISVLRIFCVPASFYNESFDDTSFIEREDEFILKERV